MKNLKTFLLALVAILTGIAAEAQSASEYEALLIQNGYQLDSNESTVNERYFSKLNTPKKYIVTMKKAGDKIQQVSVVAVIGEMGDYKFSELEPVKLYPSYFETPQEEGGLFLSVEPYIPQISIKQGQVWLSAIFKPLAPIRKE